MDSFNIPPIGVMPPPSIPDYLQSPSVAMRPQTREGQTFSDMLQKAMQPSGVDVRFSAHAKSRMESRGIDMNADDLAKLDEGIDKAQAKGAHESLILMNGNAFVVNVDNRTVITAVHPNELKGGVFTQIDSTVIL